MLHEYSSPKYYSDISSLNAWMISFKQLTIVFCINLRLEVGKEMLKMKSVSHLDSKSFLQQPYPLSEDSETLWEKNILWESLF